MIPGIRVEGWIYFKVSASVVLVFVNHGCTIFSDLSLILVLLKWVQQYKPRLETMLSQLHRLLCLLPNYVLCSIPVAEYCNHRALITLGFPQKWKNAIVKVLHKNN